MNQVSSTNVDGEASVNKEEDLSMSTEDKKDLRHSELKDAQIELSKLFSEDVSREAIDMLKYFLDKTRREMKHCKGNMDTSYTFPLIEEKETRTKIHMLIKGDLLNKYVVADTVDQKIRLWSKQFKKDNWGSKRKRGVDA